VQHYILVALDGSTLSEAILPHAVAVAHATKSALILMQVLEPVYEPIFGALGINEFVEEEQLALTHELRNEVEKGSGGVKK
jgi:nucleotide-binding universal stress UspA family protein